MNEKNILVYQIIVGNKLLIFLYEFCYYQNLPLHFISRNSVVIFLFTAE